MVSCPSGFLPLRARYSNSGTSRRHYWTDCGCSVHCNHSNHAQCWLAREIDSIYRFLPTDISTRYPDASPQISATCSHGPQGSCSHYGVQTKFETPDVNAKQVSQHHQLSGFQWRQFLRPLHPDGHFWTGLNMLHGAFGNGRVAEGEVRFVLVLYVATWDSAQLRCMTTGLLYPLPTLAATWCQTVLQLAIGRTVGYVTPETRLL